MRVKYTFETLQIGDENINVPVGESASNLHGIVKFNTEGQKILNLIGNDLSEQEIVDELCKEYDTEPNVIKEYVNSFINKLKELDLIED